MEDPLAWRDPRSVLARHGLAPKRGYSQNFLVARGAVEAIADALAPAPGEVVLELGPGLGTLTAALLRRGASVIGLERDPDMLRVLAQDLVPHAPLVLVTGDAADLDLPALAAPHGGQVALAGNLPYAITGAILRRLVEGCGAVSRAVLMVQKEVRDRLVAEPGTRDYGALTVFTQAVFAVRSVRQVPPTAFHPRPAVTSAVVSFTPLDPPRAAITPSFEAVVRAAFGQRRKTLRNALTSIAGADKARVARALADAGIDPERRGETLSIETFAQLAHSWQKAAQGEER